MVRFNLNSIRCCDLISPECNPKMRPPTTPACSLSREAALERPSIFVLAPSSAAAAHHSGRCEVEVVEPVRDVRGEGDVDDALNVDGAIGVEPFREQAYPPARPAPGRHKLPRSIELFEALPVLERLERRFDGRVVEVETKLCRLPPARLLLELRPDLRVVEIEPCILRAILNHLVRHPLQRLVHSVRPLRLFHSLRRLLSHPLLLLPGVESGARLFEDAPERLCLLSLLRLELRVMGAQSRRNLPILGLELARASKVFHRSLELLRALEAHERHRAAVQRLDERQALRLIPASARLRQSHRLRRGVHGAVESLQTKLTLRNVEVRGEEHRLRRAPLLLRDKF
mmetsp:Transcript_9155/g.30142  ORF Transcript_9155/g.30142 Transcript_9155/m.30142 type:complete len:343 (-) Transcript_9155:438-1466(-)